MLEFAVLGLLHESPMHGYELRKQLHARLGTFRAFSWGSLYPALRRLQRAGLISERDPGVEDPAGPSGARGSWGRRGRRVYEITADGKDRFDELAAEAGPHACDDESFGVHLAFFSRTPAAVRMQILEGRRRRVEERRDGLRTTLTRAGEQIDRYTRELHRLGLDTTEREVRWLNELIDHERSLDETLHRPPTPGVTSGTAGPATGAGTPGPAPSGPSAPPGR